MLNRKQKKVSQSKGGIRRSKGGEYRSAQSRALGQANGKGFWEAGGGIVWSIVMAHFSGFQATGISMGAS